MTKKYIINEYPWAFLTEEDIIFCVPTGREEDHCVFRTFNAAKKTLLYAMQETLKELDNEEIETKNEMSLGILKLKNMNEIQYRQEYPENFN